jgi:hypothetical protein
MGKLGITALRETAYSNKGSVRAKLGSVTTKIAQHNWTAAAAALATACLNHKAIARHRMQHKHRQKSFEQHILSIHRCPARAITRCR